MPRSVLIVDDDADIRETMQLVLEDEGYHVAMAADGVQALRMLDGGLRPDVILLDLMMPVMNGWQFREAQLKRPALASIPVIVISADSNLRDKVEPFGHDYLAKPLDIDELLAMIERVTPSPSR